MEDDILIDTKTVLMNEQVHGFKTRAKAVFTEVWAGYTRGHPRDNLSLGGLGLASTQDGTALDTYLLTKRFNRS